MIKAVAIDVDGTLTDAERRLHLGAVQKLREVEKLGIPVILATGNILCVSETVAIMLGTSGALIAENGGVIKDQKTNEVRYLGDITKVEKAFEHLSKKFKVRKMLRSELRKTEIAIYRDFDAEEIKKALKGFEVDVVDTKFAIHIKDPEADKGKALREVAEMMGLKLEEIAAMGDSENDREMLRISGYSIAVGEEKLREVCDYVTKAIFGEGGEEALEKVIEKIRGERKL